MIDNDGVPRLLDFGVGALLAEDESELAAEDQYGLGVVLHFAATGRPSSQEVRFDAIPADLAEVIGRLLAESPEDRFRDFGEVVRRLQPSFEATDAMSIPASSDTSARTRETNATPVEPAAIPPWRRMLDKLLFWRSPREAMALSILAPPALRPGESGVFAVFAHGTAREVQTLGGTYFPGHVLAGSVALRRPVVRGDRLTAHIALPGLTVEPPVQRFVWGGQALPLPCSVRVPADFRPGELVGVLSLARGGDIILNHEFRMFVSAE